MASLAFAGLVALVAFASAYLWAPGLVNGTSLGYAVARESGGDTGLLGVYLPNCEPNRRRAEVWDCKLLDPGESGIGGYEVTMRGATCWHARRTGPKHGSRITWPDEIDGCVRFGDNARVPRRGARAALWLLDLAAVDD